MSYPDLLSKIPENFMFLWVVSSKFIAFGLSNLETYFFQLKIFLVIA